MKQLRPYQQKAVNECWQALRLNDDPALLVASVGSGKSLMLASILLDIQASGKRALCLVNNAELVRNNCETFINQGGHSSIYCASLGQKNASAPIIFGTPQSVVNGINKNEIIGKIKFNIIIVDEAHTINYLNPHSCFIRILRHYKQTYSSMRLLGATGTNYRFKGASIVGANCLFKTQVGNITTEELIENGYLIKPEFKIDPSLMLDFSNVRVKQNGLFNQKQLEEVISKSTRLTKLICQQIVHIMNEQKRFGVFLFATTRKHAEEICSYLPENETALILGDTPHEDRTRILDDAREGRVKYLVNIAIVSVGVDVPAYDTIAYLRPTESLVLLVQTLGRALRLSHNTKKSNALILDFSGNIERHRDWDSPLLLEAVSQTIDKDKPLVIICPVCQQMNTEHARRCVGVINDKRCDYFFEFVQCPNISCKVKNDIAVRHCRVCKTEIIDPNKKLSLEKIIKNEIEVEVIRARYVITGPQTGFRVNCEYSCIDTNDNFGIVREFFTINSDKSKNIFYGNFVRQHCDQASKWYMHLHKRDKMELMLDEVKSPSRILLSLTESGSKIKKKYFDTIANDIETKS